MCITAQNKKKKSDLIKGMDAALKACKWAQSSQNPLHVAARIARDRYLLALPAHIHC